MFRRRPRPEPVPRPPDRVDRLLQDAGKAASPPFASWHDAVVALLEQGYRPLDCPAMCRRKGDHAHLRHEGASTDLIVSPAAVERSGA